MKKIIKIFGLSVLAIVIAINAYIVLSGKTYLYKAAKQMKAGIYDYTIFQNRTIETNQPQDLPNAATYSNASLPQDLEKALVENESVAFVLLKNDSVIAEKYWNHSDTSISGSFSMAKTIVGILTGVALREGQIKSLDQPVADFLPFFKGNGKEKVTFRHLLSMSGGTDWDESYNSPLSITTEAYFGEDLQKTIEKINVKDEPGKVFRYKSGETQLLGAALTKAIGMSLSKYAEEKLWKPMHATKPALWSLDRKDGIEKCYCCFNATARDFARFGLLYLHKGNWQGTQIVDTAFVEESTHPAPLLDEEGKPLDHYGFKWWMITEGNERIFYMRGILGQYVAVIPERHLVFVRLGHVAGSKAGPHRTDFLQYLRAILKNYE